MIGNMIKVNGIDLLVIDEINGNPFVIALNLGKNVVFGKSNNYKTSNLRKETEKWFAETGLKAVERTIDLIAMDGYKGFGTLTTHVAPLTFDEWRKYAEIITPHIKDWFWLATPWGSPERDNWASRRVCAVGADGSASYYTYDYSYGDSLAPTFILENYKSDLSNFSNEELIKELNKRLKG